MTVQGVIRSRAYPMFKRDMDDLCEALPDDMKKINRRVFNYVLYLEEQLSKSEQRLSQIKKLVSEA